MRKLAILVLLGSLVPCACMAKTPATQMVTVLQLEQTLANVRGKRDGSLANRISKMKLTERLSNARLAWLRKEMPGRESRQELMALAGESAFLDLPAADILSRLPLDLAQQSALLARSVDYVNSTVTHWPSFTAMRLTTRYEGTSTVIPFGLQDWLFSPNSRRSNPMNRWNCPGHPKIGYRRLTVVDVSTVALVNRNGHELTSFDAKAGEFECPEGGLSTSQEFADVLGWIPRVVSQGKVSWSHWEKGSSELLAVFRYSATVALPCCTTEKHSPPILIDVHGEIALNPADGSVLRLTEIRRWKETLPGSGSAILEYDSAVDYAPVTIAGTICLVPARRTAMYRAPALWPNGSKESQLDTRIYTSFHLSESPVEEYLIDSSFGHYQPYESRATGPSAPRRESE